MIKNDKDRGYKDTFLSIVIPVFNEEATIADIINRTKRTLERMEVKHEIVVVDDGSSDKSAYIAQKQKVQVLKNDHQGKGFALRSGFKQAKGELVVTLDADGSHIPEEIPMLLRFLIENKADFVVGSRFSNSRTNKTKIPKLNRLGNKLFNNLIGYLSQVKISDSQSGFRAFRASIIKKMKLSSHGYEIESEMLIKALKKGARLAQIAISFDQRTVGRSKLDPLRDGTRILYAIITSYLF